MKLGLDIAPDVGVNRRSRSVAQPGSASGLGPEGREFESLHSDHFFFERSYRREAVPAFCFYRLFCGLFFIIILDNLWASKKGEYSPYQQ